MDIHVVIYVISVCTNIIFFSAPTGVPQGLVLQIIESRNVTFTWLLPILTERNGIITSYNITCVTTAIGRETSLTRVYMIVESNLYTLSGFKPATGYTCQVFAINSAGRGPEANITLTTLQDGKWV